MLLSDVAISIERKAEEVRALAIAMEGKHGKELDAKENTILYLRGLTMNGV